MTFRFRTEKVQPFELVEPKPETCPLSVAALSAAAGQPSEARPDLDCLEAWRLHLRTPTADRRAASVRPCLIAALILAAMATAPMACTVQRGERERYYSARSTTVEPRPGDGRIRLTVWPRVGEARTTMAAAERTTDMP